MSNFVDSKSYVTFQQLGGKPVSLEVIKREISTLPLDGVIGILASVSLEAFQKGQSFLDPRWQGPYLNLAIVDDFPSELPNASKMYAPGKVPYTKTSNILVHHHNIAYLSHLALMHSLENQNTNELTYDIQRRICRLLLIINDLLKENLPELSKDTLEYRRAFILSWLRHWQFVQFQEWRDTMLQLARQHILLLDYLPKFFDVKTKFTRATNGINLERYFKILTLWIPHLNFGMSPWRKFWLRRSTFAKNLEANKDEFNTLFNQWIQTPKKYKESFTNWQNSNKNNDSNLIFDYVTLRKKPIIEARPNELICPVIPFLLAKIVDGPFFILSDYLSNDQGKLKKFHTALGEAYEKYAQNLVKKIAQHDKKGSWTYYENPVSGKKKHSNELTDNYLQKKDAGICFEHKGGRLHTNFLIGLESERVIGPSLRILRDLDLQETPNMKRCKKSDDGFITRPIWQICLVKKKLIDWIKEKIGSVPQKVYSIITYYPYIKIDKLCIKGYLYPLIEKMNLFNEEIFEHPQWLHISDLEALEELAQNSKLDLELLLSEKTNLENRTKRFDTFLFEKFPSQNLQNKYLISKIKEILKETGKDFFPSKRNWK
jgi:hypothetical protein